MFFGRYKAVVLPIAIALKLSSQLYFLKKHSTLDGEVKIIVEFLSKAFFSCLLQDVLYAITSSIFIPFSFRIFARFDTVFNALTYRVFLSFKYGISSYAKSFP